MKLISIGTATVDLYLTSPYFKAIRDPHLTFKKGFPDGVAECLPFGSKVDLDSVNYFAGGGAINTVSTFQQFNLEAVALFKLGSDVMAKLILQALKQERIQATPLHASGKSSFAIILLANSGERTILVFRGEQSPFQLKELPKPLSDLSLYINPGITPAEVWEEYFHRCKHEKTLVAVNPSRHFLQDKQAICALQLIDALFCNKEEAELLLGKAFETRQIMPALQAELSGVKLIAVTLGAQGAIVSYKGKIYRSRGFKVKRCTDQTGAGDAFASAVWASLLKQETIMEAMRKGFANAVSVIEQLGARAGILTEADYRGKRWQKLTVNILNSKKIS